MPDQAGLIADGRLFPPNLAGFAGTIVWDTTKPDSQPRRRSRWDYETPSNGIEALSSHTSDDASMLRCRRLQAGILSRESSDA